MQLKIQRSQRAGGVVRSTVLFCLDVRADYSAEERSNIQKYRLGSEVIYNSQRAQKHLEHAGTQLDRTQSGGVGERAAGLARGALSLAMAKMSLNISIASLGKGHHIECKDLEELLEAEETVRTACKNVTRYLEAAATFDGSETVIDYVNGAEQIHITQHAIPLLEYAPVPSEPSEAYEPSASTASSDFHSATGQNSKPLFDIVKRRWLEIEQKLMAFAKSKGWHLSEQHVRAVAGVAGLLLFVLILQIL